MIKILRSLFLSVDMAARMYGVKSPQYFRAVLRFQKQIAKIEK